MLLHILSLGLLGQPLTAVADATDRQCRPVWRLTHLPPTQPSFVSLSELLLRRVDTYTTHTVPCLRFNGHGPSPSTSRPSSALRLPQPTLVLWPYHQPSPCQGHLAQLWRQHHHHQCRPHSIPRSGMSRERARRSRSTQLPSLQKSQVCGSMSTIRPTRHSLPCTPERYRMLSAGFLKPSADHPP